MAQMTARERILAAIEFTGPDRAPIQHYAFPGAIRRHGRRLLELAERYPDDFGNAAILTNLRAVEAQGDNPEEIVEWTDEWGTVWRRLSIYTSGEVVRPGIPDWDVWARMQRPEIPPPEHFQQQALEARAAAPDRFLAFGAGGFFQALENIRGPENCWMDLAEDHPGIHELADYLVAGQLSRIEGYARSGVVDCIQLGDDWGAQDRLLIHPNTWRSFFKPRYAKMFSLARDAGIHVWFHSDGWILEIIEDLIEIGVTLLNPQHPCMGTRRVGEICGGRVCIRTDIDRQWTIPFGTPEQVVADVKEAIEVFGNFNGGVMLHGEIGPDVPFENIEALYSAFYEYGRYPLDWLSS